MENTQIRELEKGLQTVMENKGKIGIGLLYTGVCAYGAFLTCWGINDLIEHATDLEEKRALFKTSVGLGTMLVSGAITFLNSLPSYKNLDNEYNLVQRQHKSL